MIKIDRNVKSFYLFFAITGGVFTSLLPVFYVNLGYSEAQIGVLTSLIYVAAILQPIFGYLSDSKFNITSVVRFSLIILMISCVGLYFFHSFEVVFIIILLASIFRMPIPALFDSQAMDYSMKYNKNFATFRVYASFGFGASMVICLPFMYLFGFEAFLPLTFITTFIAFYTAARVPVKKQNIHKKTSYIKDLKVLFTQKSYLLVSLFTILFMGATSIKFAYQSLLLQELTGTAFYSSVAFLLSTTSEVLLMRYFVHVEKKFSFRIYMLIAVLIMLFQLLIFANCNNANVILVFALLHGVSMSIFIPGYMKKMKQSVNEEVSTSAIVITSTVQNVFTFIFSILIITPIYARYGLNEVFMIMLLVASLSIIPLLFIKEKK